MKRFDPPKLSGGLLPPATILGMPVAAGLNQKNSTSLTLGTQTAFDFFPPKNSGGQAPHNNRHLNPKMLDDARNPPQIFGGSNLVLHFVTYFWDATQEAISKIADRVQWQGVPWVESGVCQSTLADEQCISSRGTTQPLDARCIFEMACRGMGAIVQEC